MAVKDCSTRTNKETGTKAPLMRLDNAVNAPSEPKHE